MTKFKKIVSGTLAGCLMASALMMSAGAANVQTTVISKAGVQAAAQTYSNTVALNSGMASQIVALPVYSGFSVCDLKVNNKAQGHVTVSIHEGSPTGALACSAFRVEAGESKSFAGVALTEGANYVDIHTDGTCNLSGSLTYAFATAPAAQQTRTAVKINPQSADIYAEGIPAAFPSEDGKTVYTALSYNGSTYMPLRTVGRWMGKNISWDSASRTVFLSGTTEKSYPCADDDAYHKEGVKYVGATGTATLDKGVKVLVDGKQQTFKNQKGQTIYPLFYRNSIYLPLRNIGELTGMDVTWYSAKAENDVNAIFLRMPLSDSKRAEMETYATNLMKQLLDMRTDTQKFKNCDSAVKNGSYTDYVITGKAAAMAALDSIKRKAQTIRSGMAEQANPIRYYNSSLMNELDFLINNADTVMDRVKNGRVVVGSSNPDTSVVDQTAVMFSADDTMLDCERMVRMLRQNMDRLF